MPVCTWGFICIPPRLTKPPTAPQTKPESNVSGLEWRGLVIYIQKRAGRDSIPGLGLRHLVGIFFLFSFFNHLDLKLKTLWCYYKQMERVLCRAECWNSLSCARFCVSPVTLTLRYRKTKDFASQERKFASVSECGVSWKPSFKESQIPPKIKCKKLHFCKSLTKTKFLFRQLGSVG